MVLQFEADGPRFHAEEEETDVFDYFVRRGQMLVRSSD